MTLIGDTCQSNQNNYVYGGNYANDGSTCFLPSNILVPSGGTCVNVGTLPGTSIPKQCYQTDVNGCQTTYCVVNSRIANSQCTAFLDQGGYTTTKVPAGCN